MASSAGTKVTKDPASLNQPKNENPGIVTSDSLAAESIQSGGSFAANSDNRGPMGQRSEGTTANNTDVSGATKLDPAPDRAAREAAAGDTEADDLQAGNQLGGKVAGIGPTYNQATGGSGTSHSRRGEEDVQPGSGQGAPAPSYVSHSAPSQGGTYQPKGTNLQEGGFDPDAPNASFTTDIGGKNDPGRVALQKMEAADAPVAGGAGPREGKVSGDGQYDGLDETSA